MLKKCLDGVAAALGRNHHTRIEDQSHAGGVSGSRWLLTTASRSRPNSPSRVAFEPCSFAKRSDSESRRTRGAARRITATASASRSITTSAPARTRARSEVRSFAASVSETRIARLVIVPQLYRPDLIAPLVGLSWDLIGPADDERRVP